MDDDQVEADAVGTGLYCFLSETRPCGPECMAYVLRPMDKAGELNDQQRHCSVLVSTDRLGRFMGGLVSLKKQDQDDKLRKGATPPPNPRGAAT